MDRTNISYSHTTYRPIFSTFQEIATKSNTLHSFPINNMHIYINQNQTTKTCSAMKGRNEATSETKGRNQVGIGTKIKMRLFI